MKTIEEYKMGDILEDDFKKGLGNMGKIFNGKLKLVGIGYTIQDKDGSQMTLEKKHKDFNQEMIDEVEQANQDSIESDDEWLTE